MLSLTNVPHEALVGVLYQLNQHHTLALARLRFKNYHIAKPKLYRNIYVYSLWPMREELFTLILNEPKLKFQYPLKSKN